MISESCGDVLFHFSESGAIERFVPRPPAADPAFEPLVWAVDREHAAHYLLPRDCPRVCFARGPESLPEDLDRFLAFSTACRVIAVESGWLERIASTQLFRYALPAGPFHLHDACAGYWVTREPVAPVAVEPLDDLIAAIVSEGVELRLVPSLWPLHDAVASSSLDFSMIRMRNATPRDLGL